MKSLFEFLKSLDILDILDFLLKLLLLIVFSVYLFTTFKEQKAFYRISSGDRDYYTYSYDLNSEDNAVTFITVFGKTVTIYGDFAITILNVPEQGRG